MTPASDPFTTFEIEPRFDLDLRALEARHRDLSRALHPDRFAGHSSSERRMALGRAIEVNDAFRVLKDPVRRAESLARMLGLAVGETAEPRPSADLLMEMMESREELAASALASNFQRVRELGAEMRRRQASVLASLSTAFTSGELVRVPPLLGELRYIARYLDEVAAYEEVAESSTPVRG